LATPAAKGNAQVYVLLFNCILGRRHDDMTCLIYDEDFES